MRLKTVCKHVEYALKTTGLKRRFFKNVQNGLSVLNKELGTTRVLTRIPRMKNVFSTRLQPFSKAMRFSRVKNDF